METELEVKDLIFKSWFSFLLAMQTLGLIILLILVMGPRKPTLLDLAFQAFANCLATRASSLDHQIVPKLELKSPQL